ncbi:MAG: lactate racemase domain-containing protein, partial [Christensenellales bacterium]
MEIFLREQNADGLSREEIRAALLKSLEGRTYKNVLILPPDFTRFHSNAGYITNVYYHALTDMGANVDIMPALGTHEPMTREQCEKMLGDVPFEKLIAHDWRHD